MHLSCRGKGEEPVIFGNNESFGELSLLNNEKRNATVKTTKSTHFYVLHRDDYERVLGNDLDFARDRFFMKHVMGIELDPSPTGSARGLSEDQLQNSIHGSDVVSHHHRSFRSQKKSSIHSPGRVSPSSSSSRVSIVRGPDGKIHRRPNFKQSPRSRSNPEKSVQEKADIRDQDVLIRRPDSMGGGFVHVHHGPVSPVTGASSIQEDENNNCTGYDLLCAEDPAVHKSDQGNNTTKALALCCAATEDTPPAPPKRSLLTAQ